MKIGGITWWRNNYGSILQAYALQKYLRDELKHDYIIINQYSKKIVSVRNLIIKIKVIRILATFKRIIGRFGLKKLRNRVQNLQKFVDKYLITTNETYSEETISATNAVFDGFICGSDQIWNPSNTRLNSMYWLKFADLSKAKIAYAPSIGIMKTDNAESEIIANNLKTFDAISSREESGTQLINNILGCNACSTVVDPTLLVDRKIWDDLTCEPISQSRYIFTYMLRGTKQDRKQIEKFAKERQLRIVTIPFLDGENLVPYDFKFGDEKLWEASPIDFIRAIRYADFVFTDSFHCMVFSCLYHREFFTFPKKGKEQMSRIEGLQSLFGTGNRIIGEHNSIGNILGSSIDWANVEKNIMRNKENSRRYLYCAVERGILKCQSKRN